MSSNAESWTAVPTNCMRFGTGDFSLEYSVKRRIPTRGMLGLGSFGINIQGYSYGVRKPDATLLACSYDSLVERLKGRGRHISSLSHIESSLLVKHVIASLYSEHPSTIDAEFPARDLLMAPDGDAAFDDGGHVLQFDIGETVRIVGFVNSDNEDLVRRSTREVSLQSTYFYEVLEAAIKSMADDLHVVGAG